MNVLRGCEVGGGMIGMGWDSMGRQLMGRGYKCCFVGRGILDSILLR